MPESPSKPTRRKRGAAQLRAEARYRQRLALITLRLTHEEAAALDEARKQLGEALGQPVSRVEFVRSALDIALDPHD